MATAATPPSSPPLPPPPLPAAPDRPSLAEALAAGPLVLDGGLSNQLEADGHDLSTPDGLWSARLLADDPSAIAAAHAAYFAAGAQVVITSSYQASFDGFARKGIAHDEAARLLRRSVELARHAASHTPNRATDSSITTSTSNIVSSSAPTTHTTSNTPCYVAASVGPYGAILADGSEYRGRYGLTVPQLERFHRPRVEALAAAAPDVFALETIPDVDEAEALLRVVAPLGLPVWLSYTICGTRTRAGQSLADAFALAAAAACVIAVGVNCCSPADATPAVQLAASVTGKPVVVYPNSGETWDPASRSWQGSNMFDARQVRSWAAAGARLIGGCCRVGPAGITAVAHALNSAYPASRPSGKV